MPEWLEVFLLYSLVYFVILPLSIGFLMYFVWYLLSVSNDFINRNNFFLPRIHKFSEHPKNNSELEKKDLFIKSLNTKETLALIWIAGFSVLVLFLLIAQIPS